ELWQGETGDLLRMVGMSPDDESNFVPTGASIDARVARDRAKHEAKLADLNREAAQRVPGGSVRAFFLFPEEVWNADGGAFLLSKLAMFPYDDWNVMFLPDDERTAAVMKMPLHPNGNVPEFAAAANALLRDAEARYKAAYAEADRTQRFDAFGQTIEQI